MPRKIIPKECGCGCGGMTKGGTFLPGHDQKTVSAIIEKVGSIKELRRLVESTLCCELKVKL